MTLPTAGSSLSLAQIQAEFGGTSPISLSEYYAVAVSNSEYATSTLDGGRYGQPVAGGNWVLIPNSTTISIGNFFNSAAADTAPVAGFNFNNPVSFGLYTMPRSSHQEIKVFAMGAGGGGGGGSSRNYIWWNGGGGGGGGSGEVRYTNIYVTPTTQLYCFVGAAGAAGGARDGPYSGGSSGTAGGYSGVLSYDQQTWHVLAYGGGGGQVAQPGTALGGVGGIGGVGDVWTGGFPGQNAWYSYTPQIGGANKDDPVTQQRYVDQRGGLGALGRNMAYPYVSQIGPARRAVIVTATANHAAGVGTSRTPDGVYQAGVAAVPGWYPSGSGGGGGGGGVNQADNTVGMNGADGAPGYCLICW